MLLRHAFPGLLISAFLCSVSGCGDSSPSPSKSSSTSEPDNQSESDHGHTDEHSGEHSHAETAGHTLAEGANEDPTQSTDPAQVFGPGTAAPKLSIVKWLKGEPVESYAEGQIYVVEFWATWCGPCVQNMPHLVKLQKDYGDKVTIIGVSNEDEAAVTPFFERKSPSGEPWSDVLNYRIALDDNSQTSVAFMEPLKQTGIPFAIIVGKTGNMEWFGHPATIDPILAKVVDGSWDSDAARQKFVASQNTERILAEFGPRLDAAMAKKDFAAGVQICNEMLEKSPGNQQIAIVRITFLLNGGMFDEFDKAATQHVTDNQQDPMALAQIAMMITERVPSPHQDMDLALRAILQASEITGNANPSFLHTVAHVYAKREDIAEAIEWQKMAVAAAPDAEQLKQALVRYEKIANGDSDEPEPEAKPSEKPQPPAEPTAPAEQPKEEATKKPSEADAESSEQADPAQEEAAE